MVFEGYRPGYGFFNAFGALTRPLLQRGSRGSAVVEAQKKLMEILQRSFRFGADGDFGSETENAVREVQGIYLAQKPVTGVIDADTWTLLLGQEVAISGGGGTLPPSDPTPPGTVPGTPPPGPGTDVGKGDKKDNTMLYAGLGVAAVVAFVLLKGK
jgi:peptidoglycan hydrolase-like protein with peptidoglycan-binding domain